MSQFALIGDLSLHYLDEGQQDAVPLVFINSLGTDMRIWDTVAPNFADEYRLIRYDKRGHGLSDCPPAPYTIRQHSNDLLGLLDFLEIAELILIGISVGGQIALDFAATYPERVQKLILCDTAPKIGTLEMWNERINTLREHGMAHLAEAILGRWFAPTFAENEAAAYRGYYNMLTRTPLEGYTATCEAIRDADLRPMLNSIQVKTLLICGAEDLATPPQAMQDMANNLADAQFELIDSAAHLPCIENPHAMTDTIKAFLEKA